MVKVFFTWINKGVCRPKCFIERGRENRESGNHAERIEHRSNERQGIDQIPTVHLGVAAFQMEKRGIRTERGNRNREIAVTNRNLL
jgi:hypothetical protein